jgi:hypothetical protein
MADNTKQSADDNIATDDIDGVKYQRVKVVLGGDGENAGDVSAENPMPVTLKDIMLALKVLFQALANPAWVDKSANQLRAQVTGTVAATGTLTGVTTVAGVTNFGGYPAQQGIIDQNRTAWAQLVRPRIT